MNRGSAVWRAWRAYREGRLGDVAAYKSAMLRVRATPEMEARLEALPEPLPTIDLEALRALPGGTLGRAYAAHMDREKLEPLDLSDHVKSELRAHLLGLRYALLHDLFHVLLGFDTSWAGELGVWEFVGAQGYSPQYAQAARLARWVYPIVAPGQRSLFRANHARARHLAAKSEPLIVHDFSDDWARPLENVREDLALHG